MVHEHVEFLETARVEKHRNPLARRELALGVLGIDALLSSAESGRGAAGNEL